MTYQTDDTIVAVASPPGGAARGMVRLSGPGVPACVERLFEPGDSASHGAVEKLLATATGPIVLDGAFRLEEFNQTLPGEFYYWPNGHSYTGEPVAEWHTFGSPPLLDAVVRACCREENVRLAEAGEFTLRAFLSGRIDLTQAEAVLGVIDANDSSSLDVALHQLAGGLAGPLHGLRDRLIDLLGHLEAGFDFADEDIEFISSDQLRTQLDEAIERTRTLSETVRMRADTADLPRVVLIGRPNTGKSSLYNRLLGESGAIVSELPGTTRDYLAAEVELDEARFQLIDTAGQAEKTTDPLNRLARDVASRASQQAEIRLLCLDATRPLEPWELAQWEAADWEDTIGVLTKIDLLGPGAPTPIEEAGVSSTVRLIEMSNLDGRGIDWLQAELRQTVLEVGRGGGSVVATTAVRCAEALRRANGALVEARALVDSGMGEELLAAEVRLALDELGKVAGAVYTDDILDRVFSRFCVGK